MLAMRRSCPKHSPKQSGTMVCWSLAGYGLVALVAATAATLAVCRWLVFRKPGAAGRPVTIGVFHPYWLAPLVCELHSGGVGLYQSCSMYCCAAMQGAVGSESFGLPCKLWKLPTARPRHLTLSYTPEIWMHRLRRCWRRRRCAHLVAWPGIDMPLP